VRATSGRLWDLWTQGGPFIGESRPVGRVTVEPYYYLNPAIAQGIWDPAKLPVRWFQRRDNDQLEQEVPNVRSINIDRTLDTDAATCDIVISNQWMNINDGTLAGVGLENILAAPEGSDPRALGQPGFFSLFHGRTGESRARWKHTETDWSWVLVPNALLRTYQGFGGAYPELIPDAVADEKLVLTGMWLVDTVRVGTDGEITLRCRDMAKLLVDQQLYPPLMPWTQYPLRYCRWIYREETKQRVIETLVSRAGDRNFTFDTSANYAWYSGGGVHGHHPGDAFDGNRESFYLSVGNSGPEEPFAVEWVQGNCGEAIDHVYVDPYMGDYTCWVSIMENGAWVNEIGTIPYEEVGVGRYNGAYEARIPAVMRFGVPWESPTEVRLPRSYRAEKVRFTFSHLARSQWGPYPFRAGARELRVRLSENMIDRRVETYTEIVRYDGNYKDYADIVKDLLLWSGWWLYNEGPYTGIPEVFGNIESTGSYSEECFPSDAFDKRPVIDAINTVKEVVGYIFWIDEDGGAHFESPNWWSAGNFLTTGQHTDVIPEIDERVQLTSYAIDVSDRAARSLIVVSSSEPIHAHEMGGVSTWEIPEDADVLKGMMKPVIFTNGVVTSKAEQQTMAELIAMHIHFQQRLGSVTAVCNPLIQINDQVRIYERLTGDVYVHYVRGMQTQYDAESGTYTMTLTTHWLGDSGEWAVQ
jgi:hypothetical protein